MYSGLIRNVGQDVREVVYLDQDSVGPADIRDGDRKGCGVPVHEHSDVKDEVYTKCLTS